MMDDQIVERNLSLVAEVTQFILQDPSILDRLPSDFQLVVLPEDDPELSLYNLGLLTERARPDKPVVMVRLASSQAGFEHSPPQLYVPLAA